MNLQVIGISKGWLPLGMLLLGVFFVSIGSLHTVRGISSLDLRIFKKIYNKLNPYVRFFRYIWPLGTTPVAIVLIAITFIPGWKVGILAAFVYIVIAIVERIIKHKINRPRPFETLNNLEIGQPFKPEDPSHPSGDAMRVWFLSIIISALFFLSWPVRVITCLVALVLSLGRIALGVHYPLDVVSGIGLGLIGAAITLLTAGYLPI